MKRVWIALSVNACSITENYQCNWNPEFIILVQTQHFENWKRPNFRMNVSGSPRLFKHTQLIIVRYFPCVLWYEYYSNILLYKCFNYNYFNLRHLASVVKLPFSGFTTMRVDFKGCYPNGRDLKCIVQYIHIPAYVRV